MKLTKLINTIAIAELSLSAIVTAQADSKEAARKVFADNAPSVLGVRGLLKLEISMNGKPGGNQEKALTSNGVVVADGLVAVAYRTIQPNLAASMASRPGQRADTKLTVSFTRLWRWLIWLASKTLISRAFRWAGLLRSEWR